MKDLLRVCNPYNEDKVTSACAIFGMMDVTGRPLSGDAVFKAMENMHERGNGLGAGFAVYGIYPDLPEHYALHVMYETQNARHETEAFLEPRFQVERSEEVPTRKTDGISGEPLIFRYFVLPKIRTGSSQAEDDYVVERVLRINSQIDGAFVFSSGKNVGVFKGVGFPEQIARYFRLEEYQGYIWTAHSRFPTNSQAWWGGAHPFSLLDWTVVHNGELSSYGANRAYLETVGYTCTMFTDTEVLAYAVDLIMRRQKLPPEVFARIVAAPLWEEIDRMPEDEKALHTALRQVYGGLLMNGPFSVVIANRQQMFALTDRIRLRPLTAAVRESIVYFSSEEAAIRLASPHLDDVWTPMGGVPIVARLGELPSGRLSTVRSSILEVAQ